MKSIRLVIATLASCLLAGTASAQTPVVPPGSIVNAASYMRTGLPADGIAQGSMFIVFGSSLGPTDLVGAPSIPLGTELGGTSISVTVSAVTRSAFMLYTSAGQIAAVLPSDVPVGTGTLTVTYNGMTSAPTQIKVVAAGFGIFSRNQAGFGPGIVQNYVSPTEQPVNALIDSAHPGQVMILWGSGLGPIDGSDADFPPVGNLEVTVEVWVGGKLAVVQYAGRTPQFPGIDQVNFVIPPGVFGCYVPVVVVVNGVPSNWVTISVTEAGAVCSDTRSFRPGELDTLSQAGMGAFAFAELARFRGTVTIGSDTMEVAVDEARADFVKYTTAEIIAMTPSREGITPDGSCIVHLTSSDDGQSDPVSRTPLSPGVPLNVQGPLGLKTLETDGFSFGADLGGGLGDDAEPEYLDPGLYTLSGGSNQEDVGPFNTNLTLLTGLQWLNQAQFAVVNRQNEVTVRWTGADPAKEFVTIAIQAVNNDLGVGGAVFCTAAANADTFTIPVYALKALPTSTEWTGEGNPTGLLSVGTEPLNSEGRVIATGLIGGRFFYANRLVRTIVVE